MRERRALVDLLLIGFGIVYPAVVFLLRGSVDATLFVVLVLAVVALRLAFGNGGVGTWRRALLGVAVVLVALSLLDAALAARAYPVLVSLAAAAVFAVTLWHPPSLIERMAMAAGATWSPDLQLYCRKVTLVWVVWLVVNAAIAAALVLTGDDRAWALWTGLVSYLVSGALLAGEWLVRRSVIARQSR